MKCVSRYLDEARIECFGCTYHMVASEDKINSTVGDIFQAPLQKQHATEHFDTKALHARFIKISAKAL